MLIVAGSAPSSPRPTIAVEVDAASDSHFYAGLSGEVDGLFVPTYRALALGGVVNLEITLPGGAPLRIAGRIQWSRDHSHDHPRGIGIALTHLSAAERARINAFLRARPPLYYDFA
jgi:Tfp pilus assembly protein PilZ